MPASLLLRQKHKGLSRMSTERPLILWQEGGLYTFEAEMHQGCKGSVYTLLWGIDILLLFFKSEILIRRTVVNPRNKYISRASGEQRESKALKQNNNKKAQDF